MVRAELGGHPKEPGKAPVAAQAHSKGLPSHCPSYSSTSVWALPPGPQVSRGSLPPSAGSVWSSIMPRSYCPGRPAEVPWKSPLRPPACDEGRAHRQASLLLFTGPHVCLGEGIPLPRVTSETERGQPLRRALYVHDC